MAPKVTVEKTMLRGRPKEVRTVSLGDAAYARETEERIRAAMSEGPLTFEELAKAMRCQGRWNEVRRAYLDAIVLRWLNGGVLRVEETILPALVRRPHWRPRTVQKLALTGRLEGVSGGGMEPHQKFVRDRQF